MATGQSGMQRGIGEWRNGPQLACGHCSSLTDPPMTGRELRARLHEPEMEVFGKKAAPNLELGPLPVPLPLIPEGEYTAISRGSEILLMFRRRVLQIEFEIHGGAHDGTKLPWYCPLPEKGRRPPRSSYFFRAWQMVHGRAPYRGERPSTTDLVGKMFKVRVKSVKTDYHKDPLPESLWYSRIAKLLERLA